MESTNFAAFNTRAKPRAPQPNPRTPSVQKPVIGSAPSQHSDRRDGLVVERRSSSVQEHLVMVTGAPMNAICLMRSARNAI